MYRQNPHSNYFYYRCHGHEPDNKGCGNMVDLAMIDTSVILRLSKAPEKWTEWRRNQDAENYEADLADIRLALSDLTKQGLSRKDEQTERERLWADEDKYTALQESASKQPKWRKCQSVQHAATTPNTRRIAKPPASLPDRRRTFCESGL